MTDSAPLGIKVFCVLHALSLLFVTAAVAGATGGRGPLVGFTLFLLGVLPVVVALVILYGIWTAKPWSLPAGVGYLLLLLSLRLSLPLLSSVPWAAIGPAVLFNSVFLLYLYTKRSTFRTGPQAEIA